MNQPSKGRREERKYLKHEIVAYVSDVIEGFGGQCFIENTKIHICFSAAFTLLIFLFLQFLFSDKFTKPFYILLRPESRALFDGPKRKIHRSGLGQRNGFLRF